ncbi:MAG: SRPBCC domain-containing protein [Proteobacteria bacterium]|nr:SRPBCC domain-containing protein [Pseudomonadota bacterium]
MALLEHTITTSAPPSAVWAVLEDTASWPSWNTVSIARCDEGFVEGGSVRFLLKVANNMGVNATFVHVEKERHLIWKGGVPGIFRATHGFDIEPTEDGGTRIRHHELFVGLAVAPLLWWLGERQTHVYKLVNERLAAAAEAQVATD